MTHLEVQAKVQELERKLWEAENKLEDLQDLAHRKFQHFHDLARFDSLLIHKLFDEVARLDSNATKALAREINREAVELPIINLEEKDIIGTPPGYKSECILCEAETPEECDQCLDTEDDYIPDDYDCFGCFEDCDTCPIVGSTK